MKTVHSSVSDIFLDKVAEWLTQAALTGENLENIVRGFCEKMIAALLRMQNHLAVAAKMAVLGKLANNMLTTYLGGDAGKRVLNGQVRRGDGDTIRAALVMGDMRQSTMYAEKEGRQAY